MNGRSANRVIGSEHIEQARQRGRTLLEIMPGDIVTALASETAARIGVQLVEGPLEKPAYPRTDGNTSMRRSLYRRSPRWVAPRIVSRANQERQCRFGKIAVIGAGGVGANVAHLASSQDIADSIALIDIAPGIAAATALDLEHTRGITRSRATVSGSSDLTDVNGADVVIVTAGRARTPGMTRADLIGVNKRVMHSVGEVIKTQAPNAIVIVVTNPLDEMTVEMLRVTGFARERVMGMAGTLDSSRFRYSLAQAAGVLPADVEAIALGSHGDEMVPVTSLARIKGRQLHHFLDQAAIDACVKDAVTGGGQVVALKKTGSATIAPAHSTVELLDHIRGAKVGPVPVSIMMDGEYGLHDVVLGVPAQVGRSGFIAVEPLQLSNTELELLGVAARAIRKRLGAQ